MTELRALIFDVDGTLAETERDGHRVAFNLAFREAGLDWEWGVEEYGKLLSIPGGKERIRHYIEQHHLVSGIPQDLNRFIISLHRLKTEHYLTLLKSGAISLRSGVARLLKEAQVAGVLLAIATTTSLENVTGLLEATLGKAAINWFKVIGAGDMVPAKKPAPDIYTFVLTELGLNPQQCIAIEDSSHGLRSARAAGLETIVTVNAYTRGEDFYNALVVINHLGEPDQPMTVLHGDIANHRYLTLDAINRLKATKSDI